MIQIIKLIATLHVSILIFVTTNQALTYILDDNFTGVLLISCVSAAICLLVLFLHGQLEKKLQSEIYELNIKLDHAKEQETKWRDHYNELKIENDCVANNLHSHIKYWENEYNKLKQQTENENKTD
jgi:uncharacterized membrane protein YhiD involved in acid resistance